MSPSTIPYAALLAGLVLWAIHALNVYEFYTWNDSETQQYCTPQLTQGTHRFGTEVVTEPPGSIQRLDLVRFSLVPRVGPTTSRVVALPGERVALKDGLLVVNGQVVENPYVQRRRVPEWLPEMRVPAGSVFVLNDDRAKGESPSSDSRELGPIPIGAISYRFSAKPPLAVRGH